MLSEYWCYVHELALHYVVVPHIGYFSRQWVACYSIYSVSLTLLYMSFLCFQEGVLSVETGVLRQSSWHDQESVSVGGNTKLSLSLDALACVLGQVLVSGNLEGTSSWNNALVFHCVLYCSESISDGFLSLSNGVVIGTLDQDGAGEWVLDTLDESVLIISKNLLIDMLGESKVSLGHIVYAVELGSTASQWDSLTISLLGSSDTDNARACQQLKRRWVNTLLVYNDEVLVSAIAELLLEVNDLLHFVIGELSLRSNELLSLFGIGPEETGVDLGLLVLQGHIQAQNVAVIH